MGIDERDQAHRRKMSEFLARNPGIVAREQERRRQKLHRLGLAGGRR